MQDEPTKEQFLIAYNLIINPKTWTQNASARNADGKGVHPYNPTAVCFCSTGAMSKAEWDILSVGSFRDELYRFTDFFTIVDFNDETPHNRVKATWAKIGKKWGYL